MPIYERDLSEKSRVLSPREKQVIALVAQGLQNAEIAAVLGMSKDGIRVCVSRNLDKTGMWNRVELAIWHESRRRKEAG